jgi:hypothetical protein
MVNGMDRRLVRAGIGILSFQRRLKSRPTRSSNCLSSAAGQKMQSVNLSRRQLGDNEFLRVIGPMVLIVLVLGLLWAGMSFFVDDLFNSLPLHEIEAVQG